MVQGRGPPPGANLAPAQRLLASCEKGPTPIALSGVSIRTMVENDMPEVLAIERAIEGGLAPGELETMRVRRNVSYRVVSVEGLVGGHILYEFHHDRREKRREKRILRLAVGEGMRHLGLGSLLVSSLIDKRYGLEVVAPSAIDSPEQRFWSNIGGSIADLRTRYGRLLRARPFAGGRERIPHCRNAPRGAHSSLGVPVGAHP